MKPRIRALFLVVSLVGFCALVAPWVHAQSYPDRPIQLVIPYVAVATGQATGKFIMRGKPIPLESEQYWCRVIGTIQSPK